MARPLHDVADIDSIRYETMSFDGIHGRVGLTVFLPSARRVGVHGDPDILVPYSAGWGEGRGAAIFACEELTRRAHVVTVAIDYPKASLNVAEILPMRTTVLTEAIVLLKEATAYDTHDVVMLGYSRGSAPASLATLAMPERIAGLCLVAPTWFPGPLGPSQLARKGLHESARGIRRGGWVDRLGLIKATTRLAQELVTHPWDLRNDVAAIAGEGPSDIAGLVATGLPIGVIGGRHDELCEIAGIRAALDAVPGAAEHIAIREVDSDHFSYFLRPTPLQDISDEIHGLVGKVGPQ